MDLAYKWFSLKCDIRYAWIRFKEKVVMKIAWSLPKSLVYWSGIRLMSHATIGQWSNQIVPDLTVVEALTRWEK